MRVRKWLTIALSILLSVWIIHLFFFRWLKVDNDLTSKGRILIDQFYYGPRMPITPLTLPFTNGKLYTDFIQLKPFRFERKEIEREDVVAYNYPRKFDLPVDKRPLKVSRVIGLPGEKIFIRNTEVKIDGATLKPQFEAFFRYRVTCDSIEFPLKFERKYDIKSVEFIVDPWVYDVVMSTNSAKMLLKEPEILHVRKLFDFPGVMDYNVYPNNRAYKWNKDNYGPAVIPKKGMTIAFNFKNFYLYRDIMEVHENNTITMQSENLFCNGKKMRNYTFKQDYYFVLNDNRDVKSDSRDFGFLPKSHIVGKVKNY